MNRLQTDAYVDFMMFRAMYINTCTMLVQKHIDENEWKRRCLNMGFTECDLSRELTLLRLERAPTLRLANG